MVRFRDILRRSSSEIVKDGSANFPRVRYFAVMGELAENYAGTTSVLFHRSNAISACSGLPVEILVFGHIRDYDKLTDEMHSDGRLHRNVRFRSMWQDLALLEPNDLPVWDTSAFSPLNDMSTHETIYGEGVAIRRFRKDSNGKNLQIDLLRSDGSIIVSDRRDAIPTQHRGSRSIILCDRSSTPVAEFKTINSLRYYWLDNVIGHDRAVIFSDTLGMAEVTHAYKRPNVVVLQTVHNCHLDQDATGALGYAGAKSLPLLEKIDSFDSTVFLTERQFGDVTALMGPSPNWYVIPNSRTEHDQSSDRPRPRTAGIMLSQLNSRKQPNHAIRAIVQANSQLAEPISLDIYGQGDQQESLESLLEDLNASTVKLRGYDPAASDKFAESTFSLLTSESEAAPLVIVESMARGCIPIAYDIRYGPRDMITHGVNGFLVPLDDINGLADVLSHLQNMSEDSITQLRKNAIIRAHDFSDAAVLRLWADLISHTFETKANPALITVTLQSCEHQGGQDGLTIHTSIVLQRTLCEPRGYIKLLARSEPAITRVPCKVTQTGSTTYSCTALVDETQIDWFTNGILDVSLEVHDEAGQGAVRLRSQSEAQVFGHFIAYSTIHGNLSLKRS